MRNCSRVLLFLLLAGCAFLPRPAAGKPAAENRCASAVVEWLEGCGRAHDLAIVPQHCGEGFAVVELTAAVEGQTLRVEIGRADRPAARRAGGVGLSPIGEFADWSQVDISMRRGFDALVACAETADATLLAGLDRPIAAPGPPWRAPWRVFLSMALALAAWRMRGEDAGTTSDRRFVLGVVALTAATFLIRYVILEPAFFHQSGHGAGWLEAARREGPPHGPGYVELFGWIVFVSPQHQEAAAFYANAAIGALLPLLLLIVTRNAGVGGWIPWALAAVIGLDPVLARISLSESYFNPVATLLAAAAALLGWGCRSSIAIQARLAAVIGAGLLLAQAARLHPNAWLPAAAVPLVILLVPRRMRDRLTHLAFALVAIAAVVGLTTGADLLAVLRGPFGQHWTPGANPLSHGLTPILICILALVAGIIAIARAPAHPACMGVAVGGVTLAAFLFMRQLAITNDLLVYQLATLSLYAPPLVGASAALVSKGVASARANAVVALLVLIGGVATLPWRWPSMTRLTTDAREARLFIEWRKTLPPNAQVWFLCFADGENFRLPLWAPDSPPAPFAVGYELGLDDEPQPSAETIDQHLAYYYHSSMCARPNGRQWCATIESRLDLEPVQRRELAAVDSGGRPFDEPTLEVVLYRIRGRR